jgi:hypothetical protein
VQKETGFPNCDSVLLRIDSTFLQTSGDAVVDFAG